VRHIRHRAADTRLAADEEFAAFARATVRGSCAAVAGRGARSFLWAYNTLVSIASALDPLLALAGIDPCALPPAEEFLERSRPGSLQVRVGPAGITFRAFRPGEVAPSPAIVAAGAVGAGVLVPALLRGRGEANKHVCASNLWLLSAACMRYSIEAGKGFFPHSSEGSLAALRALIEFDSEGMNPRLFVCPEGDEDPAEAGADGRFHLDDGTCSYEIVPWRLRNTAQGAILLYDRRPCHGGGRNVLLSGGGVEFMSEADFQAAFARDRETYAK
jgi:hypothetical protein